MNPKELLELILSRYIIIFGGRYGTGKSLSMCALTFWSIIFNQKTNILTNMPLNFSLLQNMNISYNPLISTSQFDNIPENTIIEWDELYADLFSRNSQNVKNKYTTVFSRDIRKIKGQIIGSVQFFDMLEKNMGLILEIIIIPEYVNKYSSDRKKDIQMRLEKKDFMVNWFIIDRLEQQEYNLQVNLYPFLSMYNTNYKPITLFINHQEYIDKIQKKKTDYEIFLSKKDYEIEYRLSHFDEGMQKII